jgi:hypothetical protein
VIRKANNYRKQLQVTTATLFPLIFLGRCHPLGDSEADSW